MSHNNSSKIASLIWIKIFYINTRATSLFLPLLISTNWRKDLAPSIHTHQFKQFKLDTTAILISKGSSHFIEIPVIRSILVYSLLYHPQRMWDSLLMKKIYQREKIKFKRDLILQKLKIQDKTEKELSEESGLLMIKVIRNLNTYKDQIIKSRLAILIKTCNLSQK